MIEEYKEYLKNAEYIENEKVFIKPQNPYYEIVTIEEEAVSIQVLDTVNTFSAQQLASIESLLNMTIEIEEWHETVIANMKNSIKSYVSKNRI